jgi:hypothetical protein
MFYLTENEGKNNTKVEPCENNTSVCSYVDMRKAVIYPGNVEKQGIKSEPIIGKNFTKIYDGMREIFDGGGGE